MLWCRGVGSVRPRIENVQIIIGNHGGAWHHVARTKHRIDGVRGTDDASFTVSHGDMGGVATSGYQFQGVDIGALQPQIPSLSLDRGAKAVQYVSGIKRKLCVEYYTACN